LHEYLPQLADVIRGSSLVISHCGAGSAFEALCLRVPLLVVPNPALMDNHQIELATLLADRGHVIKCTPNAVEQGIRQIRKRALKPYLPGSASGIAHRIEQLFA
jgi:beta-1,4-N-acetylglucosaminyltransferase